jgi:hypothetical protein
MCEGLAIEIGFSLTAARVTRVLDQAFKPVATMALNLSAINSLVGQKNEVLGSIIFNKRIHSRTLILNEPIVSFSIAG